MFGYKLLKFATFLIYWLGFAPWLILILRKTKIINPLNIQDVFLQYTTLLFALILIYAVIHQVFEYFYLRYKIKKVVRKITVRHQLARLERGEIDLKAAQHISTFLKLKEPADRSKVSSRAVQTNRKQQQEENEFKIKNTSAQDLPKDLDQSEKRKVLSLSEKGQNKQVEIQGENNVSVEKPMNGKPVSIVLPSYRESIVQEEDNTVA